MKVRWMSQSIRRILSCTLCVQSKVSDRIPSQPTHYIIPNSQRQPAKKFRLQKKLWQTDIHTDINTHKVISRGAPLLKIQVKGIYVKRTPWLCPATNKRQSLKINLVYCHAFRQKVRGGGKLFEPSDKIILSCCLWSFYVQGLDTTLIPYGFSIIGGYWSDDISMQFGQVAKRA